MSELKYIYKKKAEFHHSESQLTCTIQKFLQLTKHLRLRKHTQRKINQMRSAFISYLCHSSSYTRNSDDIKKRHFLGCTR